MNHNILEVKNITRCFMAGQEQECIALKHVDIQIPENKLTILKGRSGSGKTTLINIMSTLDEPDEGEVWLKDRQFSLMKEEEKEDLRRYELGFVFQSVALIPTMSAYENVDFALRLAEFDGDRRERICEVLSLVGLGKRMNHIPGQLSGGEQQRVGIARAIAHRPKLLFADEPTGALDTASGLAVMKLFLELVEKEGISIVMTTHDPNLMELSDKVYELLDGQVVKEEWHERGKAGIH